MERLKALAELVNYALVVADVLFVHIL